MSKHLRLARLLLGLSIVLIGCSRDVAKVGNTMRFFFPDGPTRFEQSGPISVATSDESVIFKSPTQSNNCMLFGGTVRLAATTPVPPLRAPVRFSYTHVPAASRNDILRIGAGADGFAIDGQGHFRFEPADAPSPWPSLYGLPPRGVERRAGGGIIASIRPVREGQFRVALVTVAAGERSSVVFRGTVLPSKGVVYVRDAVLSNVTPSFAGHSLHNCGNWDTAEEATAALGRVEARWPTPPVAGRKS